jgi:hypothetical protein
MEPMSKMIFSILFNLSYTGLPAFYPVVRLG